MNSWTKLKNKYISKRNYGPLFKVNTKVDLLSIRSKEDDFNSRMESISNDSKGRYDSTYFRDLSQSITDRSTNLSQRRLQTLASPKPVPTPRPGQI